MRTEEVALASGRASVEVFRALADDTRLRAVLLLHGEGELCVCELTEALDISQPKTAFLIDTGLAAPHATGAR